jgi:hypothetical protein
MEANESLETRSIHPTDFSGMEESIATMGTAGGLSDANGAVNSDPL